jgi:hypothetical protein
MPQPIKHNLGVGIEGVSRVPSTIEPKDSKEKEITFLKKISTEIENLSINLSDLSDRGRRVELLSTYIFWLRHLSSLTEEILKNVSPKQSEIEDLNSDINKLLLFLDSMLSQSLKFQTTRDGWFPPRPEDLATANRLDPYGRYIDLEAVAELHRPNFWLGIKHQIEEIVEELIKIIEKKSNTSPEQSQVESGLSDEQLQEELEKFNQDLKEINEAADREILKGIVDRLFRNTISTVGSRVVDVETGRLTIIKLVFILLGEIQASVEDNKILEAVETVKGERNLCQRLRDFINQIPIIDSISSENMQRYVKIFEWLNQLKGRKVTITLRDTSKLFYLKALLEKINKQEKEILDIFNRILEELGQELNIDVFTNALRFLIKIIETNETRIKNSASVKIGFVNLKTMQMKRGIETSDTTSMMVLKEKPDVDNDENPIVCKFIPYSQYMRGLFNIDKISLVGK